VLTVGAVGLHGTFPPESHQALDASGPSSVEGLFPARFTNCGPEVDVCAPGLSIVSAVPRGGYAALDGTCLAATHVTAVAALVLAHHPMFRDGHGPLGAERVDRLFALIKSSARQLVFGPYSSADPARCGAGIPDAAQCVGGGYGPVAVQPWTTALPLPDPLAELARALGRPVGYPVG
jgi:subtilisin family serine protease